MRAPPIKSMHLLLGAIRKRIAFFWVYASRACKLVGIQEEDHNVPFATTRRCIAEL